MSARATDEEVIFGEALECPSPDAQAAFLDQACRGDQDLRRRVESLLRARVGHPTFLAKPAVVTGALLTLDASGSVIGPYKLLERIGEGGFGEVYMAEQAEPVRRRVAIKIIKPGMDTRQVLSRFEAERQALAMMDHPNIARVLDAGATDAHSPLGPGRPYVVMELVRGRPITRFCDEERLSVPDRLALLIDACHAVQHAHQKGIIHRDLKPSNVLVSRHDDRPVVKIIDFGIAKATGAAGGRLTDKTLFTEFRQMIGTPAYMSPEQAGLSDLDVDTRSDVYSLGVLLYELLTGATPFEPERLRGAEFDEMRRIIREEEPPQPSTRLNRLFSQSQPISLTANDPSPSSSSIATIAQARRSDPRTLARSLSGEPDWIVMKCLEKDRTRRYETPNVLAMDIERYLAGEAVVAAPPSATYRLKKFVQRRRLQVTAVGAIALVLVAGVAGTTGGLIWALSEKDRATTAAESEAKARRRAERISEFVTTALKAGDALNSAGGGATESAGWDMTVLAAMDNAIEDIGSGRFQDDPETEAELRGTIGFILRNNGKYDKARPLLEQALAMRERLYTDDDPRIADTMNELALLYQDMSQDAQAEPLFAKALSIRETALGPDHPNVANSLNNLAMLYSRQGRNAQAEPLLTRALAICQRAFGPDHPTVARSLNNLGEHHSRQNQLGDAEPLYMRALAIREKAHGPAHPNVATSLGNLAALYTRQRRFAEAEPLFMRAFEIQQKAFGPDHPIVLSTKGNLGAMYWKQGRLQESIPLFESVLQAESATLGRQHRQTLETMANLGVNYKDSGRTGDAIPLLEEAYGASKHHTSMGWVGTQLLDAYAALAESAEPQRIAKVKVLLQELIADARETLPKGGRALANKLDTLGRLLLRHQLWDEAEPLIREALTIHQATAPDSARRFHTMSLLGGTLLGQNRLADAEPMLLEGYRGMTERQGAIPPQNDAFVREALERLVHLYEAKGDEAEAALWRRALETNPALGPAP